MSREMEYTWPDNFSDDIPPEDAVPAAGLVYRLVDSIPPTEKDFLPYNIEKPSYEPPDDRCRIRSFGISTWSKKSKIVKAREKYPAAEQFGNKLIASGDLVAELGVIQRSRSGHVTLWKQVGSKPHLHVCNEEN